MGTPEALVRLSGDLEHSLTPQPPCCRGRPSAGGRPRSFRYPLDVGKSSTHSPPQRGSGPIPPEPWGSHSPAQLPCRPPWCFSQSFLQDHSVVLDPPGGGSTQGKTGTPSVLATRRGEIDGVRVLEKCGWVLHESVHGTQIDRRGIRSRSDRDR